MAKKKSDLPENAPRKIDPKTCKNIKMLIGTYYKVLETKNFIFYILKDDEESGLMYSAKNGKLISDNYFAGVGLLDEILNDKQKYVFISNKLKPYLEKIRADYIEHKEPIL